MVKEILLKCFKLLLKQLLCLNESCMYIYIEHNMS